MLAFLLVAGQSSLGEEARLPSSRNVTFGPAEAWVISPAKLRGEPVHDPTRPHKIKVDGKTITISPTAAYPSLEEVRRGADGSLLIRRASRQAAWSSQDSIWFAGKETAISNLSVDLYFDRRNYAGSIVREGVAPEAVVIEGGRRRTLGPGEVLYWLTGGPWVVGVPIDATGRAASTEETVSVATRIVDEKRSVVFSGFHFLGRIGSGSFVLAKPRYVVMYSPGRAMEHWRLPEGWRAEGVSPSGWILLRRGKELEPMPEIPREDGEMEDWSKRMAEWQRNSERAITARELDWTVALLRAGKVSPVQFTRPPKTDHLLWRDRPEWEGNSFRINAFWGKDRRAFQVTKAP